MRAWLLLIVLACGSAGVRAAGGETYPTRPLRFIIPFAAGGGADAVARIVAQGLAEVVGQPVVPDNRPGGGATIATELVARSTPDGYTLIQGSSTSMSVNPVLMKVRYDPAADFAAITSLGEQPHALVVNPALRVQNVRDLVAYAKAQPSPLHYSSSGNGGPTHLGCELFKLATGLDMTHVPYRGQSAGVTAVISGEVQISMPSFASVQSHVKRGALRALAMTSRARLPLMPEVPTLIEQGYPGFTVSSWTGLFAPAGTPRPIVSYLHKSVVAALAQPDVARKLANIGVEPGGLDTPAFAAFVRDDIRKWAKVVKAAQIRID